MEMSDEMVMQVLLLASMMTTILGLVWSARVIFEGCAGLKRDGIPVGKVQEVKKKDIMPLLWAPMYSGIAAEITFAALALLLPMGTYARVALLTAALIFAALTVHLAKYFSKAGRETPVT